jgi:hypothetical protein
MKLEDIHKKNVFKVPEHYFEDFPGRLQKRIEAEETGRKTPVFRLRTLINIAAAAAVLIFVTYGIIRVNRVSSVDRLLSNISTEELINYLLDSDISTEELLEDLDMTIIAYSEDPLNDELMPPDSIDDDTIDELLDEYEIEMEYL